VKDACWTSVGYRSNSVKITEKRFKIIEIRLKEIEILIFIVYELIQGFPNCALREGRKCSTKKC
jgi:hypothetical protein